MTLQPTDTSQSGDVTEFNRSFKKPIVSPADSKMGYLGKELGEQHLVRIINDRPSAWVGQKRVRTVIRRRIVMIYAPLQEDFSMRTEAVWNVTTAAYVLSKVGNEFTQAALGRASVNRYTSRRIWTGTSPITFTLNLQFLAISDPYQEVLYPILELQRMSLPYAAGWLGDYLLSPPGPDPFDIKILQDAKESFGLSAGRDEGEVITAHIGTFVTVRKCVVKAIDVKFSKNLTTAGIPISALASVTFETFEIQTKDSLDTEVGGNPPIYNQGITSETTKDHSLIDPAVTAGDLNPNLGNLA